MNVLELRRCASAVYADEFPVFPDLRDRRFLFYAVSTHMWVSNGKAEHNEGWCYEDEVFHTGCIRRQLSLFTCLVVFFKEYNHESK